MVVFIWPFCSISFAADNSKEKPKSDSIKIVIEDFYDQKLLGRKDIGKNLPGVFHLLLDQYHGFFDVVPRQELWKVLLMQIGEEQEVIQLHKEFFKKEFYELGKRIFSDQVYKEISPDYILGGDYTLENEEINLRLMVKGYSNKNPSFISLGPYQLQMKSLVKELDLVVQEIFKSLGKNETLSLIIGGFFEQEKDGKAYPFEGEQNGRGQILTGIVHDHLLEQFGSPFPKGDEKVWLVVTDERGYFSPHCKEVVKKSSIFEEKNSEKNLESWKVVLVGTIFEDEEAVHVTPKFCVFQKGGGSPTLLTEFNGNQLKLDLERDQKKLHYGWIGKELSLELYLFLKELISSRGKWDKESIELVQSSKFSVNKAQRLFDNGKYFLAEHVLSQEMVHSGNRKKCPTNASVEKGYYLRGLIYENLTNIYQEIYTEKIDSWLSTGICFYEKFLKDLRSENNRAGNSIFYPKALMGKAELYHRKWLLLSSENQEDQELKEAVISSHKEVFEIGLEKLEQIEDSEEKIVLREKIFQISERYGNFLLRRKDFVQAERVFEVLKDKDPNDLKLLAGFGISLMEQMKYQEAVKQFNQIIKLAEKNPVPPQALVDRVKFWIKKLGSDMYYEKANEKISSAYESIEKKEKIDKSILDAIEYLKQFIKVENWEGLKTENYYQAILQIADLFAALEQYDHSVQYLKRLKSELNEERKNLDPSYLMVAEYFLIKVKGLRGHYGKIELNEDLDSFSSEERITERGSLGIKWNWREYFKISKKNPYSINNLGEVLSILEDRLLYVSQKIQR